LLNNLQDFLHYATVVAIIGMGNDLRGDDAVGLHIVRLLKPYVSQRLRVYDGQMTPEAFIGPACSVHPSHVLIIDAAELKKKPGDWQIIPLDAVEQGLFTTHSIPAIEVAAELQRRCHASVVFLGVQPKTRDIALGLSPECQQAAKEIADILRDILS
jgi:hydrogenase 3 maturation protease